MNDSPAGGIRRTLTELKRRRVFRVAAVYGAVGWGILQLADVLVPALELPDSVTRGLALLLVLLFPIALVLAWAFEVTPTGISRTSPAARAEVARIARQPGGYRWPIALAAVAGSTLLLWNVWLTLGGGSRNELPTPVDVAGLDENVLTVLPFAVEGSPEIAYLGNGIVSLLSTKLDGAGELRSVDSRSILRLVEREGYTPGDRAGARNISAVFRAGLFVTGDIVEAAGEMQVSAGIHRAGGDDTELAEATVVGSADSVFEVVDDLTSQLLSKLRGGPAARVQRIAAVTTSSVPALKAFLAGEEHFRAGQFIDGMESFARATEEDSLFALAFYRLSIAAEWSFATQRSIAAADRAVELADRLSERDRRILEAYRMRRFGRNTEAAEIYRSILSTYPDEMEAWLDLSEVVFHANPLHGRSISESTATLGRVLAFDPHHATALIHYARVAAYLEDPAGVDSLTARFLEMNPEAGRNLELTAVRAIGMRDSVAVADLKKRLRTADEPGAALAAWGAGVFAKDIDVARAASESLAQPERSPEGRRLGLAQLAHLAAAEERWEDAESALRALDQISRGNALEHRTMLALLPFRETDLDLLRRLHRELLDLDPTTIERSDNPSAIFTVHDELHPLIRFYLLGLSAAKLGLDDEARGWADSLAAIPWRPTITSLPQDLALGVRVEAFIDEGKPEEALAALERQTRHMWYATTAVSPLFTQVRERYVQAELLAELGREDEARRYYSTIDQLSVFDLPYRTPAARRLAELGGAASSAAGGTRE